MRKPPTYWLGAIAAATLAAASFSGASASAAPPDERPTMPTGALTSAVQKAPQATADKWTPARMRSAIEVSPSLSTKEIKKVQEQKVTMGKQRSRAGVNPTSALGTQDALEAQACEALVSTTSSKQYQGCDWHYKQQGKLFFHDPKAVEGKDRFVCSGTVMVSGNKSIVLTAGHCVHRGSGGSGGFYNEHVFVPAYDNGAAPHGKWTGYKLSTTEAWGNTGNWAGDVGYVVTNKLGGKTIQDTVGATGYTFGGNYQGHQTWAFGYPQAAPYNGQKSYYCAGKTYAGLAAGTKGMNCYMTGGASGGGWLVGLNIAAKTGTLTSVNSYKHRDDASRMYGPHLGAAAQDAYNKANGVVVP